MGWHKIRELQIDSHETNEGCSLWTRGGLRGVEVHFENNIIHIPMDVLGELVASEYISRQISRFEQMDTKQAIEDMFRDAEN